MGFKSILVVFALVFAAFSYHNQDVAWADGGLKKIVIDNNSRMDIAKLYPSDLDGGNWGKELLNGKTIGDGDSATINIDDRLKMLDLKAVSSTGVERIYYGIDVQKYLKVRLNAADVEPFE